MNLVESKLHGVLIESSWCDQCDFILGKTAEFVLLRIFLNFSVDSALIIYMVDAVLFIVFYYGNSIVWMWGVGINIVAIESVSILLSPKTGLIYLEWFLVALS